MATILSFQGATPRIHPSAWIAPTAVVNGAPAVMKKELSEAALAAVVHGAEHYVALGRAYREAHGG